MWVFHLVTVKSALLWYNVQNEIPKSLGGRFNSIILRPKNGPKNGPKSAFGTSICMNFFSWGKFSKQFHKNGPKFGLKIGPKNGLKSVPKKIYAIESPPCFTLLLTVGGRGGVPGRCCCCNGRPWPRTRPRWGCPR